MDPRSGRFCRWALDNDRPEVVHIGQRRSGDHRVAQAFKERVSVVVVKMVTRSQAHGPGASQGVRGQKGPGYFLLAVHAIGVPSQRVHAGFAVLGALLSLPNQSPIEVFSNNPNLRDLPSFGADVVT